MVRKWISVFIVFLFLPLLAYGEVETYPISEIREQTPAYWNGTAKSGKKQFEFRAPVFIPQVDSLPVLKAKRAVLSQEKLDEYSDILMESGVDETLGFYCFGDFSAFIDWPENKVRWSVTTDYLNNLWEEEPLRSLDQVFAENQEFSLADALSGTKGFFEEVYCDADAEFIPYHVAIRSPEFIRKGKTKTDEYFDCGPLTGKGWYLIDGWQALEGIPILASADDVQKNQNGHPVCALRNMMMPPTFDISLWHEHHWSLNSIYPYEKTGQAVDDLAVCSFDTIKNQLQRMIDEGDLRYVYAIELGYVVYADPDVAYSKDKSEIAKQEFLLVPTWVAEVSRSKSSSGRKLDSFNGLEGSYGGMSPNGYDAYSYLAQDTGYEKIHFNAQTGEVLNCKLWDNNDTSLLYPKALGYDLEN